MRSGRYVMGWKLKAETASCGFGSRQPGRARRGTPRISNDWVGGSLLAEEQANIVLTRAKLMPARLYRDTPEETSNTWRDVGMREIVAFEEQRGICGLGERVGGAIGEVEPRLRIEPLP